MSSGSHGFGQMQTNVYTWVGINFPTLADATRQAAATREGGATDKTIGLVDLRQPRIEEWQTQGASIKNITFTGLTTKPMFITLDDASSPALEQVLFNVFVEDWSYPKEYASERSVEVALLLREQGGLVLAFGDVPNARFKVHSICAVRQDFAAMLAGRSFVRGM